MTNLKSKMLDPAEYAAKAAQLAAEMEEKRIANLALNYVPALDYEDPCDTIRGTCCSDPSFPVLGGMDFVYYKLTGMVAMGDAKNKAKLTTIGKTYTFWFIDKSYANLFLSNPQDYVPKYGGFNADAFCAYGGGFDNLLQTDTMVSAATALPNKQLTFSSPDIDAAKCDQLWANYFGATVSAVFNIRCFSFSGLDNAFGMYPHMPAEAIPVKMSILYGPPAVTSATTSANEPTATAPAAFDTQAVSPMNSQLPTAAEYYSSQTSQVQQQTPQTFQVQSPQTMPLQTTQQPPQVQSQNFQAQQPLAQPPQSFQAQQPQTHEPLLDSLPSWEQFAPPSVPQQSNPSPPKSPPAPVPASASQFNLPVQTTPVSPIISQQSSLPQTQPAVRSNQVMQSPSQPQSAGMMQGPTQAIPQPALGNQGIQNTQPLANRLSTLPVAAPAAQSPNVATTNRITPAGVSVNVQPNAPIDHEPEHELGVKALIKRGVVEAPTAVLVSMLEGRDTLKKTGTTP